MKTSRRLADTPRRAPGVGSERAGETEPLPTPTGTAAAESLAGLRPLTAAERHQRIAERAYTRAAARGFVGDRQLDDWLAAEREIDSEDLSVLRSL
jgi:Protein of unknown function (DUF2934)